MLFLGGGGASLSVFPPHISLLSLFLFPSLPAAKWPLIVASGSQAPPVAKRMLFKLKT